MLIYSYVIVLYIEVTLIQSKMNILIQNETRAVYKALYDVIELLYLKKGEYFDVLVIGQEYDVNSILSGIMKHSKEILAYKLEMYKKLPKHVFKLQTFIILSSLDDLNNLNSRDMLRFQDSTQIHFLIYITGQVDEYAFIDLFYEPINLFDRKMTLYEYFIFDIGDTVIYVTIEWFTKKSCNYPHVKILNQFNKTSLEWINVMKYSQKFTEFNGCKLVFMVPTDSNIWNHAVVNKEFTKFEVSGIAPTVFQEMSKKYNFIDDYQPVIIKSLEDLIEKHKVYVVKINGLSKNIDVYFDISHFDGYNFIFSINTAIFGKSS
ncbi:hypothetical protein ACKWTF_013338 [Chironomus riparius]